MNKKQRLAAAAKVAAAASQIESQVENTVASEETSAAATEIENSEAAVEPAIEAATGTEGEATIEPTVGLRKNAKVVSSKMKVAFLQPLIEAGNHTAKELAALLKAEFPQMTDVTIFTFLTDSKNVKYNKFDRLVTINSEKKMVFVSEIKEAA